MQKAVKEITVEGKVDGLGGCAVECLKSGGASVVKWMARLFNVYIS